eukprot:4216622-Heterocapsa_arctica.AAC.1
MPRGQRAEHMTAALGSMVPGNSSAGYGPTGKAEQRYQPGPPTLSRRHTADNLLIACAATITGCK